MFGWLVLCLSLPLLIKTAAAGSVSLKLALGGFPRSQGLCLEGGWKGFSPPPQENKAPTELHRWAHLEAPGASAQPRSPAGHPRPGGAASLPRHGQGAARPSWGAPSPAPPALSGPGLPPPPPGGPGRGAAGGGRCGSTLRCRGGGAPRSSAPPKTAMLRAVKVMGGGKSRQAFEQAEGWGAKQVETQRFLHGMYWQLALDGSSSLVS